MKRNLSVYGAAYFVMLLLAFVLLLAYPKLELHLLLNACHTSFQDTFFKYYTTLAEWPLYLLALLPLCWKKYRLCLFYALSELTAGGVLQILKHSFAADRPIVVFENFPDVVLPLVEGVDMHHSNSFPSGHASTFFVFFTCCALFLAYYYKQKGRQPDALLYSAQLAFLILAALGAYSRIYLSQHFMVDIFVGSIIGFVTPLIYYKYFSKIKKLEN